NQKSQPRKFTIKQLGSHWRKSLYHFEGWQYTLRITLCIVVAEIVRAIWPYQHGYWILLTVAIVVRRNIHQSLHRMFQRSAGTFIGVIIVCSIIYLVPTQWELVLMIAVLAAARSFLKETNYFSYAIVTTALVLILLDFGNV